jgi:hypothetical protein
MLFDKVQMMKSYSDQTGRFPIPSSHGNHYIFVLYHHDTNSIHAVAIPNRQAASIRKAWETTHKSLIAQGHAPNLHILDNECSQELKDSFLKYIIAFQRVLPKEHRANAAERAIRTFKNHSISTLCTVDSHFPLSEWDRLLPQAILTLNLLRSSRMHPSLSAHASLFGHYDFNRVPLAPPGTKVVGHVASEGRTTFGEHGKVGWYIGPSPEHYRCYKCYFPDTMAEGDVLTVDFFPEKIPFPTFTTADYLKQTAEDMLHLLQTPRTTSTPPTLAFGSPILNSYEVFAEILQRAVPPPAPVAPTHVSPSPVSAQRVLTQHPTPASPVSVAPQRVPTPSLSIQKSQPVKHPFSASSPITKYRELSPRFSHRPTPRQQLAQSLQHDPTFSS